MNQPTPENLAAAREPIASLISKSAKAQQKLSPGTWQHRMLDDNLRALRLAAALMDTSVRATEPVGHDDLRQALVVLGAIIARVDKARGGFSPGTSQHSLQQNRLNALRVAEAVLQRAAQDRSSDRCVDTP